MGRKLNERIGKIQKSLKLTSVDITAEAIVRELATDVNSPDEINFMPRGLFRRGYEKDVSAIELDEEENGHCLKLIVNREGIFDTLPQGVFYEPEPADSKSQDSKDFTEMALIVSRQMKEAMEAGRTFFRPFDNIAFQALCRLEYIEHQSYYDSAHIKSEICDLFWPEWKGLLSKKQKIQLFTLTLNAYKIAGKLDVIGAELTEFLSSNVVLTYSEQQVLEADGAVSRKLGQLVLGVDSYTYQKQIVYSTGINIIIGPLNPIEALEFSFGKPQWILVNFIAELLLPLELSWEIKTVLKKEAKGFELSNKQKSVIGFTTIGLTTVL